MYYIFIFLIHTQWFKCSASLDEKYFFSFSYTVSIRFDEF